MQDILSPVAEISECLSLFNTKETIKALKKGNSTIPDNTTIPNNSTILDSATVPNNTTGPTTIPNNTTILDNTTGPITIPNNTTILDNTTISDYTTSLNLSINSSGLLTDLISTTNLNSTAGLNITTSDQDNMPSTSTTSKKRKLDLDKKLENTIPPKKRISLFTSSTDPQKHQRRTLKAKLMKINQKRCIISGTKIIFENSSAKDRQIGGVAGRASHLVGRALIMRTQLEKEGKQYEEDFERIPDNLMRIFNNDAYCTMSAILCTEEWDTLVDAGLITFKGNRIQYARQLLDGLVGNIPERPLPKLSTREIKKWPPEEIIVANHPEWPPEEVFAFHRSHAYSKWDYSAYQ